MSAQTGGTLPLSEQPFDTLQAITEAKRCLRCKVPQCVKGCPIENNIPEFIHQLSKGNMGSAMKIINETSNLPAICGRVCPHEKQCQGHCVLGKKGDPIKIGRLESFIADFDTGMELIREDIPQKTRGRVAVIGSGPAGLTVAGTLARQGFKVTIFEGHKEPGGVLLYGIPEYRLPKAVVRQEIEKIQALGVEFKTECMVGRNGITVDSIFEDGYDAIFIGTGTARPKDMDIPGNRLRGVNQALYLLHQVSAFNEGAISRRFVPIREGGRVAVIGGGNVTMDAVRTAKRLGAKKVSVVYRRRVADMTALPSEIEGAIAEGIEVQTLKAPSSLDIDENNHVKGIYVSPQMISAIKDGRASIRPTGEEDVYIPCDILVVAIGQNIETKHFEDAGIPVNRGKIVTKNNGAIENLPDVFAGGDCASGPASVIKAIAAAKVAAANIDEYLGYHHEISCDVEIPEARLDDRTPCGRVNLTEREACERVKDWNGCENCMTEREAKQEASRCLRCDHFGYGIFKGGRETLW